MTVFPITLPDDDFASLSLTGETVVGAVESPWTREEQIFEHQGQLWLLEAAYPPKVGRAAAEPILAALGSLRGKAGSFLLGDTNARTPRGSVAGTPLVDGASQTGNSLATKGWTPSATGVLLAGDYIQLGSGATQRLYKLLADADADGAGLATLEIWPRLRESPADSAALTTSDCKGVFRLAGNARPWSVRPPSIYDIALQAREAI